MKIKFIPQNIEVEGTPDKSLLQIATENHLEIRSICKGVPSCAECRVRISEGDSNVLPPNKAELGLIGTNYFIDGRRLSCHVRCFGDVTVDLTEQIERQENQTKKIRGFRVSKQTESKAVNDMMLLNEAEDKISGESSATNEDAMNESSAETSAPEAREEKGSRAQQQNQPQNQQRQSQQPRQQNRSQNQGQGKQQNQQSQKQGKQQQQNQQKQRPPQNQNRQQRPQQSPQQSRDGQQKPKK